MLDLFRHKYINKFQLVDSFGILWAPDSAIVRSSFLAAVDVFVYILHSQLRYLYLEISCWEIVTLTFHAVIDSASVSLILGIVLWKSSASCHAFQSSLHLSLAVFFVAPCYLKRIFESEKLNELHTSLQLFTPVYFRRYLRRVTKNALACIFSRRLATFHSKNQCISFRLLSRFFSASS